MNLCNFTWRDGWNAMHRCVFSANIPHDKHRCACDATKRQETTR